MMLANLAAQQLGYIPNQPNQNPPQNPPPQVNNNQVVPYGPIPPPNQNLHLPKQIPQFITQNQRNNAVLQYRAGIPRQIQDNPFRNLNQIQIDNAPAPVQPQHNYVIRNNQQIQHAPKTFHQ